MPNVVADDLMHEQGSDTIPTLPNIFFTHFKLRLDEGNQVRFRQRQCQAGGSASFSEMKLTSHVIRLQSRRVLRARDVARIESFNQHDTIILDQQRRKLTVTDIDGGHMLRATLQKNLRETAG